MYGICNLSNIPLRIEPNDRSEIVSQVLFGEHFRVLEKQKQWLKIKLHFDQYQGWIDEKQMMYLSEISYKKLSKAPIILNGDFIEYITTKNNFMLPIPLGSSISFLKNKEINSQKYLFDGKKSSGVQPKSELIKTALLYLNSPYLWGGKTPFGIDCSGFTQMVYKLNGYKLFRDASQQATQGESLSFIEECEPGDLAFFDNQDGDIIHVGIIMNDNHIIHASGKVRIDLLDHLGIYNPETKKHTHKLRIIKKII